MNAFGRVHLPRAGDLYYGWVIVALGFLTLTVCFGIWYSFSVFLIAVTPDLGGSQAARAGVFSLFMTVHAAMAFVMGGLIDKYGGRVVISLASAVAAAGLFSCSLADSLRGLYVGYGLVTALGICGMGHFAQSVILPNWFVRRRGLAIGVVLAGSGIGMLLIVPLIQHVIATSGWRYAYRVLALLVLVCVLPVNALLQRRSPGEMGQFPDGDARARPVSLEQAAVETPGQQVRRVLATQFFWFLVIARFSNVMATQGVIIHQVAHSVVQGLSAAEGAFYLGLSGVVSSGGKLLFGALSDRLGRDHAYVLGIACAIGGIVCLLAPPSWLFLILYALLLGLGQGAMVPIFPARAADLFHEPAYGKIYGLFTLAGGIGAAFGAWFSGKLFDLTGTYHAFFLVSMGLLVVSALLFRKTTPRPTVPARPGP